MNRHPLLYFLAGGALVPEYALLDPRNQSSCTRREPAAGPGGVVGALASPCGSICPLEYLPEKQEWNLAQPDLWIGVDREEKLLPSHVQRETVRSGHPVVLGDNQVWEIPVARVVFGGSGLPRRRVFNTEGKVVWEVGKEYRELCEFAEKAWSWRHGEAPMISDDELDRFCGQALSVNYRIGRIEAVALGLFTDAGIRAIVDAILDWPTVIQILDAQKKTPGTPGS